MSIVEQVKAMEKKDVLAKLKASGLKTYGVYEEPLTENWQTAAALSKAEGCPLKIVAGLNNSDTTGVLLEVLRSEISKVIAGMQIAADVMEAEEMILYLPEYAANMETVSNQAEAAGIRVMTGIISHRTYKGCILNHIVTMLDVAECMSDSYQGGIYVAVNKEAVKRVPEETKIADLMTEKTVKALQLGYRLHGPEAMALTVGQAGVTNGVIRVMTDKDCLVKETEAILGASRKQSCGRCVFCREGLLQLHSMVKEMQEGKGKAEYLDFIREIGEAMTYSTPCSLGQKSAEIILSGLEYFKDEYEGHMKKKKCLAGACFSSVTYYVDPKTCEGCGDCIDVCPVDCIEGKPGYISMIDPLDCIACGKCMEACETDSVCKTEGKLPKLPNRLTKCGKFKKR